MEDDDSSERRVTVRSRWSPKPEQIIILESIFNSGTVNPSKDETIKIRKLLEKFGTVADANVFYWFQNRRSRSRRRQRQLQQLAAQEATHLHNDGGASASASITHQSPPCHYDHQSNNNHSSSVASISSVAMATYNNSGGCSSSEWMSSHQEQMDHLHHHDLFFSPDYHHMGFPEIDHSCDFNFLSAGSMTVFINGVATDVPRGSIDIKSMFGEDTVLVHSSGLPLPTNEFGFLMEDLQHGESYFLVSKAT